MKFPLDFIESQLKSIIETWLIPEDKRGFQHQLIHLVVTAMEDEAYTAPDGTILSPSQFILRSHPEVTRELEGSSVLESLADSLTSAAETAGIHFTGKVKLRLEADSRSPIDQIQVQVQKSIPDTSRTSVLRLRPYEPADAPARQASGGGFLILPDNTVYPLKQPVTNIGRRPDNQIVLSDQRVSRLHAQIRYARGQFTLFDLNSTGGTEVNGVRIRQHPLKPGDVIQLAGYPLIYGEEHQNAPDQTDDTKGMNPTQTRSDPPQEGQH